MLFIVDVAVTAVVEAAVVGAGNNVVVALVAAAVVVDIHGAVVGVADRQRC